ncbi:hypothetical protein CRE_18335 [Caenorhabditis remanei]|uniref:Uncharacterized protein n=1 Tax=Caenorhabditis remanei TaxID=31234 RepID=E3NR60_CAERE|nr:hypothetical protein CRE_18335 [Caenorhabditis remanei]
MEVSTVNDVKIYNLSAGKSLPEWMSSRARRKLEQRNTDVRQRIQLIQDFEMPDVSNTVNITPDGKYVWASGNYKPWLKCYDLNNLSLKFERGLDADVVKLIPLSEDYSKVVILEEERWIEMHAMLGRYFRMRMPCQGRDMALSEESSDLYLVGSKSEVYRFNLEQGCWLTPFEATAPLNCVQVCTEHQLVICGTTNGVVEAWDHRDRSLCGTLDTGASVNSYIGENKSIAVTSLAFSDPLHIGVGTSSGQIVTYDLRARRPLIIKDHNNELPIKKIEFIKREDGDVVASMDSRMLKLWYEEDGIKSMIADEREESAVKKKVEKLPAVNKSLAARLRDEAAAADKKAETKKEKKKSKKSDAASTLLADDRFKKLFESEDFEVDETSEQFLKNASIAQKMKAKGPVEVDSEGEEESGEESGSEVDSEVQASGSDDEESNSAVWMEEEVHGTDMTSDLESASSDEDVDQSLKKKRAKVRAARKIERNIQKSQKYDERKEAKKVRKEQRLATKPSKFVLHSIGSGETTRKFVDETVANKADGPSEESMALGDRKTASNRRDRKAKKVNEDEVPFGGREMTFTISKRDKDLRAEAAKSKQAAHVAERKEVTRRPNALVTKGLKKLPGNLNVGKRQNTF